MDTDQQKLQAILNDAVDRAQQSSERGQVAHYIPELAKADPRKAGIAVTLNNGETIGAGDWQQPNTIQSISKVFTLALCWAQWAIIYGAAWGANLLARHLILFCSSSTRMAFLEIRLLTPGRLW